MLDNFLAFDTAARKKSFDCAPSAIFSSLLGLIFLEEMLIASLSSPADSKHLTAFDVAPQPRRIMVACEISCRAVDGPQGVEAVVKYLREVSHHQCYTAKFKRLIDSSFSPLSTQSVVAIWNNVSAKSTPAGSSKYI